MEVPQIRYVEKIVDVSVVKSLEQIIEILFGADHRDPSLWIRSSTQREYQEAAGEAIYLPVDLSTVQGQEPTITEQIHEVGPDLQTQAIQIVGVQQAACISL